MNVNDRVQLKPVSGRVIELLGEVNGKETVKCSFTVAGVPIIIDLPVNLLNNA